MNNKYLLSDLVARLQKKGYDAKQADLLTRAFFHAIEQGLEQDEVVKINQFGQFKLQKVDARQSVDVNTGARVEIKAHSKISFTPDAYLKDLVNTPLAHLQPVALDEPSNKKLRQEINSNLLKGTAAPSTEPVKKTVTETEQAELVAQTSVEPKAEEPRAEISTPVQEEIIVEMAPSQESADNNEPEKPSKVTEMKKQEEKALFEVQDTTESKTKENKKKKNGWLLILCVLAIALIIYAMLAKENKKEVLSESLVIEQTTTQPAAEPVQAPQAAQEPELDPSAWPTLKEVSLAKGERLTLLALENYGDKVFWVYIYQANKDRIANPNDIKAGTRIRIPQLPVALINAKSADAMAKAKALEEKYKAEFSK